MVKNKSSPTRLLFRKLIHQSRNIENIIALRYWLSATKFTDFQLLYMLLTGFDLVLSNRYIPQMYLDNNPDVSKNTWKQLNYAAHGPDDIFVVIIVV